MQRFKNNMSDGWLFRQELRLFRNFMRNWKRDVDDCDFFDIFANGNNTTENEAKAFLKKYFSLETLAKCDSVSVERVRDKAGDEGANSRFLVGVLLDGWPDPRTLEQGQGEPRTLPRNAWRMV